MRRVLEVLLAALLLVGLVVLIVRSRAPEPATVTVTLPQSIAIRNVYVETCSTGVAFLITTKANHDSVVVSNFSWIKP